jgi:superfamily II DNA/RNA helicase
VPTKELAVQIHGEIKMLIAGGKQRRKAFPIEVSDTPHRNNSVSAPFVHYRNTILIHTNTILISC